MGDVRTRVDAEVAQFIARQHVFFVATAPLDARGHVNLSPKGLDTFAVIDATTVAYLDLTGSGVETIAHLRENGRITLCFCAFEGPPRIVRIYGRGTALVSGTPDFAALRARFGDFAGVRSIVRVDVERVADSCGYGVPRYQFDGERTQLGAWAERKGPEGLASYRRKHNRASIDGLPGVDDD